MLSRRNSDEAAKIGEFIEIVNPVSRQIVRPWPLLIKF